MSDAPAVQIWWPQVNNTETLITSLCVQQLQFVPSSLTSRQTDTHSQTEFDQLIWIAQQADFGEISSNSDDSIAFKRFSGLSPGATWPLTFWPENLISTSPGPGTHVT